MGNVVSEKLDQLRKSFNSDEECCEKPKVIKKTSKLKLLAAFGTGATIGTSVTAYLAYRLFKGFFGSWLNARL